MEKLSIAQSKSLSNILGNIAVAWFTVGVITPLFTTFIRKSSFISNVLISLILTTCFIYASLEVVKNIKR
jgi:hypothetical protein